VSFEHWEELCDRLWELEIDRSVSWLWRLDKANLGITQQGAAVQPRGVRLRRYTVIGVVDQEKD